MQLRCPIFCAFVLIGSVLPANALEPTLDSASTDACLQSAKETPEHCIGLFYKSCTDTREGSTTRGMGECAARETAIWQNKIDAAMKQLLEGLLGKTEAQPWNRPNENKRERPVPGTDILDDMEKTWVVWRAKKCDAMAMQAEGGSLSRVIYGTCVYDETARHALWLRELADDTTPK